MLVGLDVSAGAILGILGYGRIGQAVARRALAFDMTVMATSRRAQPGTTTDGVTFANTPTLLAESDIVSVHTPCPREMSDGMLTSTSCHTRTPGLSGLSPLDALRVERVSRKPPRG